MWIRLELLRYIEKGEKEVKNVKAILSYHRRRPTAIFDEDDNHFVERIEGLWSRELKKEGREGRKRI